MIGAHDDDDPPPEDGSLNAAELLGRINSEMTAPVADWERVRLLASNLGRVAHDQARLAQADRLRDFATRVYYECRLRFGQNPECLPVIGAAGDEQTLTIRCLVHAPDAGGRNPTKDWAEKCLSDLMASLFEQVRPRFAAIAARTLAFAEDESDDHCAMIVAVVNGQTGDAACFAGPRPEIEPERPHLLAVQAGYADRIETLRAFFAGQHPKIDFGEDAYWRKSLALARAHASDQPARKS